MNHSVDLFSTFPTCYSIFFEQPLSIASSQTYNFSFVPNYTHLSSSHFFRLVSIRFSSPNRFILPLHTVPISLYTPFTNHFYLHTVILSHCIPSLFPLYPWRNSTAFHFILPNSINVLRIVPREVRSERLA